MGLKHRHTYEALTAELKATEKWYIQPQIAGKINVALIYPNLYSLGMSNLGFLTVHRLVSSVPGIGVERFFPALEAEKPLSPPFYSFETNRPLADFDLLMFSFSYEGDFDKIPGIFSALGIPVKSKERNGFHPIMVAGGAAVASNAVALSGIFDILVPGEAETTVVPLLESFLKNGFDLETVAELPGVWVPKYKDSVVPAEKPCEVDMEPAWSHIVSSRNAFGGAHIIEIMRGCPRICKFCLARVIYKPVREVSRNTLQSWLDQHPECHDLGLVAPSLFDHSEIDEIFAMLIERRIRIRNSSIKWEKLTPNIITALRQSDVKSLTVAPETGSEKLRMAMGKQMNEDRFCKKIKEIADAGFENLKMYFVAGLPGETDEDLQKTAELIARVLENAGKMSLSVAFSFFVPKKGTPWENEEYLSQSAIKRKIRYIKELLQTYPGQIKASFESPHEVCRQARLSQIGPELSEEYDREAKACRENRLFARNQFSVLEF
ncbi:MAG: radical SAM protein [Candidatus Rifleibacteriota bacterium]